MALPVIMPHTMTLRICALAVAIVFTSTAAWGQSLYLDEGQRGVEASAGWSVGPSSNGLETFVSGSPNGRVDVGVGISRYTFTFDDDSKSTYKEYAPFVRYFLTKEQNGAAVSLAASAQYFHADYGTPDSGKYVQAGLTAYKSLKLSEQIGIQPFIGFAFVAESYAFGGAPPDRARYLTRDLGIHFTTRLDRPWVLRATLIEQSFRRETYRGARMAILRLF
jgi:hypothetical protein